MKLKNCYTFFVVLLFILNFHNTKGQTVMSGRVIDLKTSAPISYVSISSERKSLTSFVANEDGEFKISINKAMDSLCFSSVGYESYIISIKDIWATKLPVEVKLKPIVIALDDITIYPAKVLVRKAIEHAPKNYYPDIFSISGLYRERIKLDNQYVGFAESTFSYLDWGYNKQRLKTPLSKFSVNPFKFIDSRRSNYYLSTSKLGMERWFLHFENFYFEKKYIRDGFFLGDEIDMHEYSYEGESYYNGQKVHIINFKPNSKMIKKFMKDPKYNHLLALGTIYIADEDFAIVKYSITMSNNWYLDYIRQDNELAKRYKVEYLNAEVNYTKLKDKYFVDYSHLECKYNDVVNSKQVHEISEIFIDHRDLEPLKSEMYKHYENIYNWNYFTAEPNRWVMGKYIPSFWEHYVGVPIEDFKKIVNDLELTEPLETQFINNSEKPLTKN